MVTETHEILLQVWREVSRHLEIEESLMTISEILRLQSNITSLRLDRLYTNPARVETIALGASDQFLQRSVSELLTAEQHKTLQDLASADQLIFGANAKEFHSLAPIVNGPPSGLHWILPVSTDNKCVGLLYVTTTSSKDPTDLGRLLHALVEPFSVALSNDQRLKELKSLREAADADRRILLERLGRHQVEDEIVGANRGLKNVMERVELIAGSDVPVLILGETGTGKEVISRAIHLRSNRSSGPFVRVNCGAIPSELIDSQLFGHEKGSFTGAVDQHQGWFERADGGTLFLDEIGELPLAAQVRLLRVLQDHQIERVGGKKAIHVDVRIVAATHRDLSNMVRERTFREDLWYRINVFPIFLPRLRDRIEDLPILANHFARRAAGRFGLPFVEPSPQDVLLLANYNWPGNIRELGAVVDRAVILGRGKSFDVAGALGLAQQELISVDTGPTFYEVIPEGPQSKSLINVAQPPIVDLNEAMKDHIKKALSACRGRIEGELGAAKMLGINPHTLRARMRKLKIDWDSFRE